MFKWLKKSTKAVSTNVVDTGKDLLGSNTIAQAGNEIKIMAETILSPKETIKNAKTETFKEAMIRKNVSEVDLVLIYKNYTYIFYISITFAVLLLVPLFYKLFYRHEVFTSITLLIFFIFCMANAFKYSFRAFQIKHRKLCNVNEWWERAGEWFPSLNQLK